MREYGADISIKTFFKLYWDRSQGMKIRIPKAMDAAFAEPETDEERQIKALIDEYDKQQATKLEQELFKQRSRHKIEGRELGAGEKEENVILEFRPKPTQEMLVACLWSHWKEGEDSLLWFAAITDEPPAEVAAAGHDRCIIPIKPENLDAWLSPSSNLAESYAILDDRARPYYEHRLAA